MRSSLRRPVGLAVLLAATAGGASCGTSTSAPSVDATIDHVSLPGAPDVAVVPDAGADAGALSTHLRVALLSPLGFGVDVCVTPATGNTQGPLLFDEHQLQTEVDAGATDAAQDATGHDAAASDAGGEDSGRRDASSGTDDAATDAPSDADAAPDAADAGPLTDGSTDAETTDATMDASQDSGTVTTDGGTRFGGVLVNQVSNYLTVSGAGTFEVTIVTGGSQSCPSSGGLGSRRLTFDPGKFYTLVVDLPPSVVVDAGHDGSSGHDATVTDATLDADASDGEAGQAVDAARDDAPPPSDASRADADADGSQTAAPPPLGIIALTDERAVSATLATARFFNATSFGAVGAAAVGALRVVVVEQASVIPLASAVLPGQTSTPHAENPGVDTLGYWTGTLPPATSLVDLRVGAPIDAGQGGDAEVDGGVGQPSWTFVTSDDFALAASSNHTGFLAAGNGAPLTLLWCDDTTAIGGAGLTSCVLFTGK